MANAITDKTTLALIAEVQQRRAAIAKADRPQWLTNSAFSFVEGRPRPST
jgi:hypothetical protein